MADILCPWRTYNQTVFVQNSLELKLKNKDGNKFQFAPVGPLQKLEEACSNGTIKDPLQYLAEETVYAKRLGIGDFELRFSMFMIHHRNYNSVNGRKKIWSLCSQELDPEELFEFMKSVGCVGGKDKDELMDRMPEEQRIEFLLERLVELKGADEGYEMLLDYCMKHDYKHILNEEKKLYTAKVIISTRMKESAEASVSDSEYTTSIDIQDPKSYFDTIAEDVDAKEIIMKFEPALDSTTAEDVDDANVDQESDMVVAHDWDTTRDEAVRMDPDVPKDDELVGTNFNGEKREKTENHSEPVTSDEEEMAADINANERNNLMFMSGIQQLLHSTVSECDQLQFDRRIVQKLKVLDEALEKRVKRGQEFMKMVNHPLLLNQLWRR